MSQISAIGSALPAANHNRKLAKQLAMMLTMTKFMRLVAKAGLSLPNTVGSMAGMNTSWQTAMTTSCHTTTTGALPWQHPSVDHGPP